MKNDIKNKILRITKYHNFSQNVLLKKKKSHLHLANFHFRVNYPFNTILALF